MDTKQLSGSFFRGFIASFLLAATLCLSSLPAMAANGKKPSELVGGSSSSAAAPCEQPDGIGSVFYNFKKLYVVYFDFPNQGPISSKDLPDALKYERFNETLINALKANFGACLKNADGSDKPIIVSKPSHMIKDYKEQEQVLEHQIHDPDNLTLAIRITYAPTKAHPKPPYGQAISYFYRPEAPHKLARLPLSNNSRFMTFFPGDAEDFAKRLTGFFKSLKPARTVHLRGDMRYFNLSEDKGN